MMLTISQQEENPAYLCDRQYFQNCQQQYCPWDLLIMRFNSPATQEAFVFLPPESGRAMIMVEETLWDSEVMKTACSHPVFLGRSLTDPSPHAVRKATWRSPTAGARAQSQLSVQSPVSACTWRVPEENVQMFHLTSPYTEPSQLSEPSENAKMTFDLKSRDSLLWQ